MPDKHAKPIKTRPFDPVNYLKSDIAIATYLEEALAIGDPAFIADALGVVARARGMAKIAKKTGKGREALHQTLSLEGNPEFATVLAVLKALGLRLSVVPIEAKGG